MRLGSPEISLQQNQARCMLTSLLAQMLVLLLCHSVHVLASKLRPRLTFDPPPKDLLSFKRDFLPVWKRYSFEPDEINPNVCQSSAWADLLKEAKWNFPWPSTFQRKHQDYRAKIVYLGYWIYFGCNKYFGFLPYQFANENTDPRFSDYSTEAILKMTKWNIYQLIKSYSWYKCPLVLFSAYCNSASENIGHVCPNTDLRDSFHSKSHWCFLHEQPLWFWSGVFFLSHKDTVLPYFYYRG